MSSYVVNNTHINSIGKALEKIILNNDQFYVPFTLKTVFPAIYNASTVAREDVEKEIKSIMFTLIELNVKCVASQYDNKDQNEIDLEIKEMQASAKTYTPFKPLSTMGLHKALTCLDYQIEDDEIKLTQKHKNALFFLRTIKNQVADYLVKSTPQWENADWEIQ